MKNFKEEEIDILIEALDSWEDKDCFGEMIGSLMGALLNDRLSDEGKKKKLIENKKREAIQEQAKKMRKETSILIKAKLLNLKESVGIEKLQEL